MAVSDGSASKVSIGAPFMLVDREKTIKAAVKTAMEGHPPVPNSAEPESNEEWFPACEENQDALIRISYP